LAADRIRLLRDAQDRGWLAALEKHLAQAGMQREYVREHVANEARADFRFLMSLSADSTVLDIGSAWGSLSVAFARSTRLVFALDTAMDSLQFVRMRAQQERLDNVVPFLGDATCLPLPPASCDGVLMVGVLERVSQGRNDGPPQVLQVRALGEAYQVLRPGGQLYLGTDNRLGFRSILGRPEPHTGLRYISLLPRFLADAYSMKARGKPFREWTYSQSGLRKMLARAGFVATKFYYPIPGHQMPRYITDYSAPWMSRFLLSRFEGHGGFTEGLRIAALLATTARVERLLSPCFSVLARKPDD
jgi:SAM-dependent methyltransferase